jgi:hypothetical protein
VSFQNKESRHLVATTDASDRFAKLNAILLLFLLKTDD